VRSTLSYQRYRRAGKVEVYYTIEGSVLMPKGDPVLGFNRTIDGVIAISGNGNVLAMVEELEAISRRLTSSDDKDEGRITVFEWNGSSWDPRGRNTFEGRTIALSYDGSILAVGEDDGVEVHIWNENNWEALGKELDIPGSLLSLSLSSDGHKVAVGGVGQSGNGQRGFVEVIHWNGQSWNTIGRRIEDGFSQGGEFGHSVALSSHGTTLAVGSPGDDSLDGSISVFDLKGDGQWGRRGDKIFGDDNGRLGESVAISWDGNIVVGGEPLYNDVGRVCIFNWNGAEGSWDQQGNSIVGSDGSEMGSAVALSDDGSRVIVGAPSHQFVGLVRVFEFV